MPSIPEKVNLPVYSTVVSWREKEGRYRLQGITCNDCGKMVFPKNSVCPYCRSKNIELTEFKQTGSIITDPQLNTFAMASFQDTLPVHLVFVQLDEGPIVMAELVHYPPPMEYKSGTRVKMVLRKLKREAIGNYLYGFKFKIIE